MYDEVLVTVPVMGLEVLMNHIGIDDKDTLSSSVGSFDGIMEKTCGFIDRRYPEEKYGYGDGGIRMWSMKFNSRRRRSFNRT